ncbi:MAG: DUF4238 domain-containing protein [Flavobacteriales bacterium]|nr:DUF4238 domain-containing protein [Flavobacteriales bacterium]
MGQRTEFDDGSWRHHFIPEHFIKGFVDSEGSLFRYDKDEDQIARRKFAPKQVFFQPDGNTANVGLIRTTLAETYSSSLDSDLSSQLTRIRENSTNPLTNNVENYATLLSIAADLFFRVPSNDAYYNLLYERSGLQALDKDGNVIEAAQELLETGRFAQKTLKSLLPQNFLGQLLKQTAVHDRMQPRIAAFSYGVFVLSDNPVVFSELPTRWQDFMQNFILPISSTQFFIYCDKPGYGRELSLPLNYNALAIEQAQRYVCSGSEVVLSAAVKYWKELRVKGYLPGKELTIFEDAIREEGVQ